MELKETIDGMISTDYRERFKAEYRQTKERYERLKAFCNRIEAGVMARFAAWVAIRIEAAERTGREEPRHDCPLELLREQQKRMGMYLETLEIRAAIEQIDLNT